MIHPSEGKTVLVVDDDPAWCRWVADYLLAHGHGAITATSVGDALETLRTKAIGLVVLDVLFGKQMERAGIELADKLSQHREWRAIPIVFLTVLGVAEVLRELAMRRIPVDPERVRILEKPFDFPDFLRNVEELLSARGSQRGSKEEGA